MPRTAPQAPRGNSIQKKIIHGNTYSHFQVRFGWRKKIKLNLLRKLAFPAALKAILTLLVPKGQTARKRSVLHPKEQSVVLVQRASVSPAESGGLSKTSPSLNLLCATRAGDKQPPAAPKLPILPSVLLNKDHFFKRRRNKLKKIK